MQTLRKIQPRDMNTAGFSQPVGEVLTTSTNGKERVQDPNAA